MNYYSHHSDINIPRSNMIFPDDRDCVPAVSLEWKPTFCDGLQGRGVVAGMDCVVRDVCIATLNRTWHRQANK